MRPAITHGSRWKVQRWSAIVSTIAFVFAATSGAAVALAADDEGAPFSPRPSNPSRFTADAKEIVRDVFRVVAYEYYVDTARGGGFLFSQQFQLEALRCADVQKLLMTRSSSIQGALNVGRCVDDEAEKIKRYAHSAQKELDDTIDALKRGGATVRTDMKPLRSSKSAGPRGSEIHTFPVLWVSHGMGMLETAVLIPATGGDVYLVQADIDSSCTGATPERLKYCIDVSKAITDIVRRMYERYSR